MGRQLLCHLFPWRDLDRSRIHGIHIGDGGAWNRPKLQKFSTIQRYIGYDWDLDTQSVRLPDNKFRKIQDTLNHWLTQAVLYTPPCGPSGLHMDSKQSEDSPRTVQAVLGKS